LIAKKNIMFEFDRRLLVEISPQRLSVRDLKSGLAVSEVPELAIDAQANKVLGMGAQARAAAAQIPEAKLVNPFAHPRSLVSDFTSGQLLLRAFVRRVSPRHWLHPAPLVFLHPVGDPEGGYTQIERRALREMALGAGARNVVLCIDGVPSDREMLEMKMAARFVQD
jgi:rod shape-determining protein MreB